MSDRTIVGRRLAELALLAAVVAVPLAAAAGIERVVDLPKAALMLVFSVVAAAALVTAVAGGFDGRLDRRVRAVLAFAGAWLAWSVVSGLAGLPAVEIFWGDPRRLDGSLVLACAMILAAVPLVFRTSGSIVWTAVAAAAAAVATHILVMASGLESGPLARSYEARPASTLGNPIFAAAFLLFGAAAAARGLLQGSRTVGMAGAWAAAAAAVLPLAASATGHHLVALGLAALPMAVALALPNLPARAGLDPARILNGAILGIVSAAILATQSRGPSLGLAAGVVVATAAWLLVHGRRRLLLAGAGVALVTVLAIGAMLSNPESALGRRMASLPVLDRVAEELADPQSGTFAVRLRLWALAAHAFDDKPLRLVTGYGPGVTDLVLAPLAVDGVGRIETAGVRPDRAHNLAWDQFLAHGIVGLGFALALWIAMLLAGLQSAGIAGDRASRRAALAAMVTCGPVVGAVFYAFPATRAEAGLVVHLGIVVGLGLFLLASAARRANASGAPITAQATGGIVVLGLGAAFLVESSVGILTPVTLLLLLLSAALAVTAPSRRPDADAVEASDDRVDDALVAAAATGSVALATGLAMLSEGPWPAAVVPVPVLFVLASARASGRHMTPMAWAALALAFAAPLLVLWAGRGVVTSWPATLFPVGAFTLLGMGLAAGLRTPLSRPAAGALVLVVAATSWFLSSTLRADALFAQAQAAQSQGRWSEAVAPAEEAWRLARRNIQYRTGAAVAEANVLVHFAPDGPRPQRTALEQSRARIEGILAVRPDFDILMRYRAILRGREAMLTPPGPERDAILGDAMEYFREAAAAPMVSFSTWDAWGQFAMSLGRYDEAERAWVGALRDGSTRQQARALVSLGNIDIARNDIRRGLARLRAALVHLDDDPIALRTAALAAMYAGLTDEAVGYLERGLRITPGNIQLIGDLVAVLARSGRCEDAAARLGAARQAAPDDGTLRMIEGRLAGICAAEGAPGGTPGGAMEGSPGSAPVPPSGTPQPIEPSGLRRP